MQCRHFGGTWSPGPGRYKTPDRPLHPEVAGRGETGPEGDRGSGSVRRPPSPARPGGASGGAVWDAQASCLVLPLSARPVPALQGCVCLSPPRPTGHRPRSPPKALGSPAQKETVKNGRRQEGVERDRGPSGWLIGERTRPGGRLRPRQCAPEPGAGKAPWDCYRIS